MTTLAPGDMHNDHQDDPWMRKVTDVYDPARLVDHVIAHGNYEGTYPMSGGGQETGTERPQTPLQALLWLTSQYTPVTDDDRKAMFILTRFVNGNGDWSEVGYQQYQRMLRLAQAEAKVDERRRERVQQFIDNARG